MTFGWLYEWVDEIKAVSPNSGQVSFISENEADWVGKIHSSDVPRLSKPETPCVQTIDVQDDQMILPAATAAAAE